VARSCRGIQRRPALSAWKASKLFAHQTNIRLTRRLRRCSYHQLDCQSDVAWQQLGIGNAFKQCGHTLPAHGAPVNAHGCERGNRTGCQVKVVVPNEGTLIWHGDATLLQHVQNH
jgi:hypothetical protein